MTFAVRARSKATSREDGSYVVAYGYFNSEGIWVQTEYIPGTVLAGGAIEGYTTVTGGGIVEIFRL